MLILAQVQIPGSGKLIDGGVDGVQSVPQDQVGLGLADGLTGIAGGAIADGPLVDVPVSGGAEALELLDEVDHILAVVPGGCGAGVNGSHGEQADDEHQRKNHASKSSFHYYSLLCQLLMVLL